MQAKINALEKPDYFFFKDKSTARYLTMYGLYLFILVGVLNFYSFYARENDL